MSLKLYEDALSSSLASKNDWETNCDFSHSLPSEIIIKFELPLNYNLIIDRM